MEIDNAIFQDLERFGKGMFGIASHSPLEMLIPLQGLEKN